MKNANIAYTSTTAQNYDTDRIKEAIWNKEQIFVQQFVSKIKNKTTILDLPVGTGRFLDIYKNHNHNYIGIDISADMLEIAKQKVPPTTSDLLLQGTSINMPLPDKSVGTSICWRLAHLLTEDELLKTIKEFKRVTQSEIILQTYTYQEIKKRPFPLVILGKIKNFFFPHPHKSAPWINIKSYSYTEDRFETLFKSAQVTIKEKHVIHDDINKETIYVLSC